MTQHQAAPQLQQQLDDLFKSEELESQQFDKRFPTRDDLHQLSKIKCKYNVKVKKIRLAMERTKNSKRS